MSFEELGITHKRLDDTLVAYLRFQLQDRGELRSKFEALRKQCQEYICGPAFAVFHWDTGLEGLDTEACFPVTQAVQTDGIKSRMLEGGEALAILHYGSYENLREGYRKVSGCASEHGLNIENTSREIYLEFNADDPEENVTEIQIFFVNWDERLAENLERVLGEDAGKEVVGGVDEVTLESSRDERARWVKAAMERLDELADEEQKFEVLSRCAHVFSYKRIERLRAVYEQNGDIHEVLEAMGEDPDWYEEPVRVDDIIYVTKVPANRKGYEEATNEADKKMHYCHCAIIHRNLDEISPVFCYCGAGWYRQIWEGILDKPVRVEILKSLTKGDDTCQFAIHLPS